MKAEAPIPNRKGTVNEKGNGPLSEISGRAQYTWNRLGEFKAVTNLVNGVDVSHLRTPLDRKKTREY